MRKQVKFLVSGAAALLMLLGFQPQAAYALDVNGRINTDSRWTQADSPVLITGDVRLAEGAVLTIDPGVEVLFQSPPDVREGFSIRVDGTLVARGSQSRPIVFTAADRDVPWGAIIFSDTSRDWDPAAETGSVMEYCLLEYGGNEPDGDGMICTFDAMPLIAGNAIRFSDAAGIAAAVSEEPAGVASLSGNIGIVSNLIYGNATGIRLDAEGGVVRNNYLLYNNRGIDARVRSNDADFSGNTILSTAPELFGTGIRLALDERAGGIVRYQWRQTGGPDVALERPESPAAAFVAPDPGNRVETLDFELRVMGKDGGQARQAVSITVIGDNPPPVADAGADRNISLDREEGQILIVGLSGAGSTDPYLGIESYAWEQTAGPSVNLQGADTMTPAFALPNATAPGDRMTFQLTVTDQAGVTDTDTVNLVYYRGNIYPRADAGEDRTVSQGAEVTLDAAGSEDPDGSIAAYAWEQTAGPDVALAASDTARPRFAAPSDNQEQEVLTFQLRVTDNGGLEAVDEVAITVNSSVVADAGPDRTVSAGERIILDGSGSVDREAAANIAIEANSLKMDNSRAGLLAISAAESAAFDLNVSGNRFEAVDNEGYLVYVHDWSEEAPGSLTLPGNYWGTDDPMIIESLIYDNSDDYTLPVLAYQPMAEGDISGTGSTLHYPPLADAGADRETSADEAVTLDGTDSYDPAGIARYQWEQIEGPGVTLKSADEPEAEFIAPSGGEEGETLRFRLTVATGPTFSHSDTVAVAVSPAEPLPRTEVGGCFVQSAGAGGNSRSFSVLAAVLGLLGLSAGAALARRFSGRFFLVGLLLSILVLAAAPARAGYFSVGGGAGGDAGDVNVTVETGAKDLRALGLDFLFGLGLHLIPHSDDELPSRTISLPCPNEDCVRLESVRKGTEVGMLGRLGVEIASSDFYVSAIGGFTAYTESDLSRSPATDRVYENESDSRLEGLYGGGISYFMDFRWDVVLHVDYDNIRGVTGSIGWHW